MRLPSSRAKLRVRLSPVDVLLAATAPMAALFLRNVGLSSDSDWLLAGSYCAVSLVFTVVAFQAIGISDAIPRYISTGDVVRIAKAVLGGQLMTTIALFTITRLNGIPRSTPAIQALLLSSGLIAYRILIHLTERPRHDADRSRPTFGENVIFIGLNDWSVLVLRFLKAQVPKRWRVIAVLDEEARWVGRSVEGARVFGPPAQLEAVIEEFATHGVNTDRVMVSGEAGALSETALAEIRNTCERHDLDLVYIPHLFAFIPHLFVLGGAQSKSRSADVDPDCFPSSRSLADVSPTSYFRFKRIFDCVTATLLLLWLLPLLGIATALVVLDVGSPVLFWQQRMGRDGRELQIYKLRTLRAPFDRRGLKVPDDRRLSWIGRWLRRFRIDELPQLVNVLVGDMSLIGPRPLLMQDQPRNSAVRLMVRPGITGWAQVNGGARLSPTEKEALDIWYICNASPVLDFRILGMTFLSLIRGDRRSEKALAQAQSLRAEHLQIVRADHDAQALKRAAVARFPTAGTEDDARTAAAMRSL